MQNKPRDMQYFSSWNHRQMDHRDEVVRIDVERIKASLESGTIKAPRSMSKEEKMKFIILIVALDG